MSPSQKDKTVLFAEIESHRGYLLRYATAKLHRGDDAEEVVQETLLGALDAIGGFAGESSLRTWLTSILKFKIVDHQRRAIVERERFVRESPAAGDDEDPEWLDRLFDETGHWRDQFATWTAPAEAHERQAFFAALEGCMDKLPANTARVFFQREVMGADTEEICKELDITPSNCWVILHRARLALRECLDRNWFGK